MKTYDHWENAKQEDKDLLDRVSKTIRSVVPQAEIIMYGSRARSDATPHSDWDFLILVDQPLPKARHRTGKGSFI